jgi:Protein of unknown function (DUF3108)
MRRTRESATTAMRRLDPARAGRAAVLALAVAAVHGWLLRDGSSPLPAATTAAAPPSLTVRQITMGPAATTAPAAPAARAREPMRETRPSVAVAQGGAARGTGDRRAAQPVSVAPPVDTAPAAGGSATDPAAVDSPRSAPGEPLAPPVYATRVPPSTELRYTLRRGTATGEALLSWRADPQRYELQLHATLPSGASVEQRSQGGFDAAGLAPERLADRRRGRDQRAANFQRERGLITFSGSRAEFPVVAGAQDRLTWLVQLAAIAAAAPQGLREGTEVSMLVVGARGAASVWRFQVQSTQPVAGPQGSSEALWLLREPQHPYDLRVEVWLDPARDFWPLRVRQTQIPGGEATEWQLSEQTGPGPGT